MATKLYLANGNAPAGYSGGEFSAAMPVGTSNTGPNPGIVLGKLDTATGNPTQASRTFNSLGQSTAQSAFLGRWISDPITVSTVNGSSWQFAFAQLEGNANANIFSTFVIYVVTAADAVRGYVFDTGALMGTGEWQLTEIGDSFSSAGTSVSGCVSTDRIALEWWMQATQGMSTVYSNQIFYGGNVDPSSGVAATSAASFVSTTQDLFAAASASDTPRIPHRFHNGLIMRGRR